MRDMLRFLAAIIVILGVIGFAHGIAERRWNSERDVVQVSSEVSHDHLGNVELPTDEAILAGGGWR